MDVTDNDRFSMSGPLSGGEALPPDMREEEHPYEPAETGERFDLSSRVMRQSARSLADAAEMREAKIRELRDMLKHGTYHVTAEQIADKMLRDTLLEQLP
jgi:flagellar biosynthesis anti-sigma factor FlgM